MRRRLNDAGSVALKFQWISVIPPEVGFVGTSIVDAEATDARAARKLFV
jgi:hypothetical protein